MCEGHKHLGTSKEGIIPSKSQGRSLRELSAGVSISSPEQTVEVFVTTYELQDDSPRALPEAIKPADTVKSLAGQVSIAANNAIDSNELNAKVLTILEEAYVAEPKYVGKNMVVSRRKWQETVIISLAQLLGLKLGRIDMETKSSRMKAERAVFNAVMKACGGQSIKIMPEFLRNPS